MIMTRIQKAKNEKRKKPEKNSMHGLTLELVIFFHSFIVIIKMDIYHPNNNSEKPITIVSRYQKKMNKKTPPPPPNNSFREPASKKKPNNNIFIINATSGHWIET